MLDRYSNLKKDILNIESDLNRRRLQIRELGESITRMESVITTSKFERENEINSEVEAMLDEEVSRCRSVYEYDRNVLEQYRLNESTRVGELKKSLKSGDAINSSVYKENFSRLVDMKDKISEAVRVYMNIQDIGIYKDFTMPFRVTTESIDELIEYMDYFYDVDRYDKFSEQVLVIDKRSSEYELRLVWFLLFALLMLLYLFKEIILLPYVLFIIGVCIVRFKHFYRLLCLISAYNTICNLETKSYDVYDKEVGDRISVEEQKLSILLDELNSLVSETKECIDREESRSIDRIRRDFNREDAYETASKRVTSSNDTLEERLEGDKKKLDSLVFELEEEMERLRNVNAELVVLREQINNVYKNLSPSFSESLLQKKFFLGFGSDGEPVSFNYDGRFTLIVYNGRQSNQISSMMDLIKMMCGQIMCSMSPLAYKMHVVDCFHAGTAVAPFQMKVGTGASELMTTVTTHDGTRKFIEEMYAEFQSRRLSVLGRHQSLDDYNLEKLKFNARTMPYLPSFLYNFKYELIVEEEKLSQLCRVAKDVGIVMFFFLDINSFNRFDSKEKDDSKSKPESLKQILQLFEDSVYRIVSTDTTVDVSKVTNQDVMSLIGG